MKLFSELREKAEQMLARPNQIFVEIRGREVLLAEGYCRIDSYTESYITLFSDSGGIAVRGKGLTLRHLSIQRIAVEGRIDSVEFL